MTFGWRATVWLGLLGALSGANTGAARAAGSADPAQQLFREGVEAARQERWVDARAAFEKAYRLSARPVVLINLAGAQARTGLLVEAARNYHRILDDGGSAETAAFRRAAADVLPALEARIPRIRLRASDFADTDVVTIDGVEIPSARIAEPQPADPGAHTLVVMRSGAERARVTFSLAEREVHDTSLPVAVAPALASGPRVPDAQPSASVSTPGVSLTASEPRAAEPPTRAWWRSPRTWIVAAGLVVAATVVTIYAVERRDDIYSGNVPPGVVSVP